MSNGINGPRNLELNTSCGICLIDKGLNGGVMVQEIAVLKRDAYTRREA